MQKRSSWFEDSSPSYFLIHSFPWDSFKWSCLYCNPGGPWQLVLGGSGLTLSGVCAGCFQCSGSAGGGKSFWWVLMEDSLPNICAQCSWLVGDGVFNHVGVCVCLHVCVILCVSGLFSQRIWLKCSLSFCWKLEIAILVED